MFVKSGLPLLSFPRPTPFALTARRFGFGLGSVVSLLAFDLGCADPNQAIKPYPQPEPVVYEVPANLVTQNATPNQVFRLGSDTNKDVSIKAWYSSGAPHLDISSVVSPVIAQRGQIASGLNQQNQAFATNYTQLLLDAAITRGLPAILSYQQSQFDRAQQSDAIGLQQFEQRLATIEGLITRLANATSQAGSNPAPQSSTLPNIASPAAPSTNP